MAQEITKPHPQDFSLETCRLLYSTAWDQAFREVMFLMAEQYSRELLVEINGRQAPSPIMQFWRESLERLSPAQMREGLRLYMQSERGSYKPNPEDIVQNAIGVQVQVKDRPVKRKDPDCPECGGSGFRQVEVKSRTRPGSKTKAVADCYCVRIDYSGKTFTSTGKQLGERSGDHPSPPTSGDPRTPGNRVISRDRVIEGKDSTRGSEPFRSITSALDSSTVEERPQPMASTGPPTRALFARRGGGMGERNEWAALGVKNQLGFSPGVDHVAGNVVKRAVESVKTMPRTKPLNDAEYNARRQMLERQKEKILAKE